jgi:hypothetical protein
VSILLIWWLDVYGGHKGLKICVSIAKKLSLRHALAPQTNQSTELLDHRKPFHRAGGRLQNHHGLLRGAARS